MVTTTAPRAGFINLDEPIRPHRGARLRAAMVEKGTAVAEKVDFEQVFYTALGGICTLSCGFYTGLFILAGGWFWLWAVPYGVLTLLAGGFTVWSALQIIR